jgi:hypothetical protein
MENIAPQVGGELENEAKTTSKHNDSFYEDETDEQLTQACGIFFSFISKEMTCESSSS